MSIVKIYVLAVEVETAIDAQAETEVSSALVTA